MAAHLICSRRQSGMSEEQLQVSYHAGNRGNSELAMHADKSGPNLDGVPYNYGATYEKLAT
ncbi:MAG: hypothetical protein DMG45_11750 [Acidobacteria bacterium]|nr:MAG: hypothetical protein DMG45_11750 [Acidobacteriota bacterium]PYT53427.1 MAG: hypothetical protein DMG46_24540 [Acidobacteriota bacterium]